MSQIRSCSSAAVLVIDGPSLFPMLIDLKLGYLYINFFVNARYCILLCVVLVMEQVSLMSYLVMFEDGRVRCFTPKHGFKATDFQATWSFCTLSFLF